MLPTRLRVVSNRMSNSVSNALSNPSRLASLRATGLLDAPPEQTFDRLTALATRLLGVPVAVVSLVDANRQFFVSCVGVGEPWKTDRQTPLSHSFCQYVVTSGEALIVNDAREHPTVRANLAVHDLNVIAYAGLPLRMSTGEVLGSFCAIDHVPRQWNEADIDALRTLADAAMAELELRMASRTLAEREARFRGALENIRALAVTLDIDGRITFVNNFLLELSGWSRDELIGSDYFERLVPRDQSAARRGLFASESLGDFASHNDGEILTKAGHRRVISWDNILLRGSNGDVQGVAGIGHDVTVQQQAARLKDELIGVVSHELRGPLTAIRGGLRLMAPHVEKLEGTSRKLFDMATRNSDRLLRLVNDLLDLERTESGAIPLERRVVPSAQLLEDARDASSGISESAGIPVEMSADDSTVEGDPDRLVQVLMNLIGNAIKFSPPDGVVQLSARRDAGEVHFMIRDQGRGIPEDQIDRIFDRFAQVEANDAKQRGGAGLGLSICRAIVLQHGGRIWAESEPGRGSTFHFVVPGVDGG